MIIAIGVKTDGRREVLGLEIGTSEAEPIWTEFLRKLTRRGLRGVKLVVSDAYEGIKAAVSKVLSATWQRCRVHFQRSALAHAGKSGRRVVSAFIATAFAQDSAEAASAQWRTVADQIRPKVPKLATLMDEAEHDVLAYMSFPKEHRAKLHSTNPIERLNGEIKRRTEIVGTFPNDEAIVRLVGALLLEQNDTWAVQRARYMTLETRAAAVYFSACINRMFGRDPAVPATPSLPEALVPLSARAGRALWIPPDCGGFCCSSPWKIRVTRRSRSSTPSHGATACSPS